VRSRLEMEGEKESEGNRKESSYFCFGEYGNSERCKTCKLRLACKQFTQEMKESLYYRYKSKYRGRGKFRRRDKY